jgi:signal peptidase I
VNLQLFRVHGDSMTPTLQEGDFVLGRRYRKRARPCTGDVVVVARPTVPPLIIKRIAASPGEALPPELGATNSLLPADKYFLVGDNTRQSTATRWIGPVERPDIIAKAWLIIWPWRRWRRPR